MNRKIFIIAVITMIVDQITKSLVAINLHVNESITIIKNFFHLTYVQNEGAAWGIFNERPVIIILATIISGIIIYKFMYSFKKCTRNNLAFGLVLGGLFGNLIDRIIFGYVRDFIDINIFNYNYPVFNISDIGVVVGIILLIIAIIKGEDNIGNSSREK